MTIESSIQNREKGKQSAKTGFEQFQEEFNKIVAGFSTSTSGEQLSNFGNLESFNKFGLDILNGLIPESEGGAYKAGFTEVARPQAEEFLTGLFPQVSGRLAEIKKAKTTPGRAGAILTGRQNILG